MDCSKVLNISADVLQNYLYGKKCNFIGTRQNNGQPSGSERNQTNGKIHFLKLHFGLENSRNLMYILKNK